MFFINLEPVLNNKDIFEIKFLHYTKIKIKEPRANKKKSDPSWDAWQM